MRWRSWVLCAVVFCWASEVVAEPYFAVREGYKCSACHVNMTGGGKRTEFAVTHARDILRYPKLFKPLAIPEDWFDGALFKYVSLGANLRVDASATFEDKPNDQGEVDNNQVFRSRLDTFEIDVSEAVGYLEIRLIPEWLTLYLDQQFAPSVRTREVWGLLTLPWDLYVKGGRMFLPYGLGLQDDTAFIRGGSNGSVTTGFSFDQQQAGLEIGWEPGPVSAAFAVSNGASGDRNVQVTGTVYSLFSDLPVVRSVMLGFSGSHVSPSGSDSSVVGGFTGFNLWRFTYLGEVDFLWDKNDLTNGNTVGRFIHYSELNCLAVDWMNLKATFSYSDDDGDLSQNANDSENRVSFGLEPFLSRFLQLRLFYSIGNGVKSQPSHNQNILTGEIHLFF